MMGQNSWSHAIAALLGMSEELWSLIRNHLLRELTK